MPKNKDAFEFVKLAGVIPPHDVEAVEAIYPGAFDAAFEAHAPKFAAVPPGQEGAAHFAALIAGDLWQKRGGAQVNENIDAVVRAHVAAAEGYLSVAGQRRVETAAKAAEAAEAAKLAELEAAKAAGSEATAPEGDAT